MQHAFICNLYGDLVLDCYSLYYVVEQEQMWAQYLLQKENLTVELMHFGRRVRQLRKHRQLTLQEIEKQIGIHNSTLSKIENGMVNVEFQTLVKIAGVLKVELVELFKYEEELR